MNPRCTGAALALLGLAAMAIGSEPLNPEQALAAFQIEPGFRIELVAAEPLVASPCAMAFDERGRLFVAENRGYPNTTEPPEGRIALLTDTDGDGRMDQRSTFAEGLTFPNGVLPWRGGVIVTCAPDVWFFQDTDGDGRADVKRLLLTGFATNGSTQLRVNCPTLGPDGWIYFAAGLSGGTITSPEHPAQPAVKMTGDLRWNPTTGEIENLDGRSQFGMSFDAAGRRFICMNRLPVQHVVLSGKWLARNPHLAFSETVQDCNERSVKTGLRGGGDGVRLFPISANITTADSHAGSFSAACGVMIWRDGAMPMEFREAALTCDPTGNLVHVDRLIGDGVTFRAQSMFPQREFLASRDNWFRPVFLTSGPDGALYLCDMYREVIEHPDYLPEEIRKRTDFEKGKSMGRIWRVWHPESALAADNRKVFTRQENAETLVARMDSRCGWETQTAFRLLIEQRPTEAAVALRRALGERASSHAQGSRLRALAALGGMDDEFLAHSLDARDIGVRTAAAWLVAERRELSPALQQAVIAMSANAQPSSDLLPCLIALGACHDGAAIPALARAILWIPQRWVSAIVKSSVAGREREWCEAVAEEFDRANGAAGFYGESGLAALADAAELAGRACPPEQRLDILKSLAARKFVHSEIQPVFSVGFADGANIHPSEYVGRRPLFEWASELALGRGPLGVREQAVRLLAKAAWADASGPLLQLLDSPENEVRLAAIRALAGFDRDEAITSLLTPERWSSALPEIRETILTNLLSRPAQMARLLGAIEAGRLPANALSATQRATFSKHADAALRERAAKLFGTTMAGDRAEALARAKGSLELKGEPENGRTLFRNLCASCHRLDREGFTVGPDLLDMRNQPKESILFHIVAPDAEVAPAFAPYLVELKDGRALSGVLTSETAASLTLRLPLGVEETILRSNTTRIEALRGSLMPTGLEAALAAQELADLLSYLKGE